MKTIALFTLESICKMFSFKLELNWFTDNLCDAITVLGDAQTQLMSEVLVKMSVLEQEYSACLHIKTFLTNTIMKVVHHIFSFYYGP